MNDVHTTVFLERSERELTARGGVREWIPIEANPNGPVAGAAGQLSGNRRVVDDWLAAIAENREPACSGLAAMKSLEVIHAIFAAGLSRGRVELPLKKREHPLS